MTDKRDVVTTYYDRIDAEDYEGVFALFAEDVTYHRPGQDPIEDMDEFQEFYLEDRPLEGGEHEVDQVVVGEDRAVVQGAFTGVQDGRRVSFDFADVHRFDADGAITERWTYTDRDEV